jgi:hypothetical protein
MNPMHHEEGIVHTRRLDHPDESYTTGSDSTFHVPRNKLLDIRYRVCDTHTTGNEHDSSVAPKRINLAVRALDERSGSEHPLRGIEGLAEKLIRETGPSTDNQRHCLLTRLNEVLTVERKFLIVELCVLLALTPRDGEGVTCPEADGGHVKVQMLAGPKLPRSGHAYRNPDRLSGQCLHSGRRHSPSHVAVQEPQQPQASVTGPESDGTLEVVEPVCLLQFEVIPETAAGNRHSNDMEREERFVEGVSDRRRRVQEEECKPTGRLSESATHIDANAHWKGPDIQQDQT